MLLAGISRVDLDDGMFGHSYGHDRSTELPEGGPGEEFFLAQATFGEMVLDDRRAPYIVAQIVRRVLAFAEYAPCGEGGA